MVGEGSTIFPPSRRAMSSCASCREPLIAVRVVRIVVDHVGRDQIVEPVELAGAPSLEDRPRRRLVPRR
jgi:hypothetical protein